MHKKIKKIISFDKRTDLEKGISNFIEWFKNYYNLNINENYRVLCLPYSGKSYYANYCKKFFRGKIKIYDKN